MKQFTIGLPLGVMIIVALFVNIATGWHKQATATLKSNTSLILVVLVASVAIVVFMTIFSMRYKWEQHEQRYKELLSQQDEPDAATWPENESNTKSTL
ncbi:MAG TPA: hypothetical protein VNA26_08570 [Chitinophagaceae bacterium]|nr:hypothetical protein [Chitinophagaceae bacterium]